VTKVKGKGKGLDTCYSAAYMSQTRDQQQRFTISEVATDGAAAHFVAIHCPRQRSIAASRQTIAPISHTRPSRRNP